MQLCAMVRSTRAGLRTLSLRSRLAGALAFFGIRVFGDSTYRAVVIALLDYGAGNLRSVQKALRFVGADVKVVTRPDEMKDARAAVLPGVGAFDDCLNSLNKQELLAATREFIETGRPFLGICVGYQALFDKSQEFNSCAAGLGIFKGDVVRFPN